MGMKKIPPMPSIIKNNVKLLNSKIKENSGNSEAFGKTTLLIKIQLNW